MRLSRGTAFYLQVSIILFFLAGSSAPTPLYARYQEAWGFSPITTTVVFGIYALAVLAALLVAGSLSDHIGRRPVLLVTTLVQAVTMILFATAGGVGALIAARVVQGLATGAAAGAVGAGMIDLDRERGTLTNSVGPLIGTATGSLLSGLLVTYLPAPTVLVYLLLAAIFVAQAIGVVFMPETVTPRPGALASLRPRLHVPPALRPAVLLAIPALVATWALMGFYASLGPALLRQLADSRSPLLGGLPIFVLAGSGTIAVLVTRARAASFVMALGAGALVVGVSILLAGISAASLPVLFVGAVVAGVGFGAGFQGAVRTVVTRAQPHERAGVLSILYVVAYLSMGVPAVLGGLRCVHGGGLAGTARELGIVVIVLAAVAFVGIVGQSAASAGLRTPAASR